jgi:4-hydroxy-tetrahydrodipicolinate reductase
MPTKIAIAGAAGRMGRRLIAIAAADAELRIVAALEQAGNAAIGTDAGVLAGIPTLSVPIMDSTSAEFDVLLDFSLPQGTTRWLQLCQESGRCIVIGTTGQTDAQLQQIRDASKTIPVLKAPNMSVGVNVLLRLTRELARILDASYDIEITETHHRFKIDAPSGTALALCDAVRQGRQLVGTPVPSVTYGRHGPVGQRPAGQVGIHSLRIGDTVGEHAISFGALGETVTVTHTAHSRDTFAVGALRAAKWIAGKSPGLYDMQHVLFGEIPHAPAPPETAPE